MQDCVSYENNTKSKAIVMIPSLAKKTTISSRNKTIQNGSQKVPIPTPQMNQLKTRILGSKTSALFRPPSQIPRTRVSETPVPSRTSSTVSSLALRAAPVTTLKPVTTIAQALSATQKASAITNNKSKPPPPVTAKKGLTKFSNPIECQRLFQNLNNRISDLEKTLDDKKKETHELATKWNHATKLGVGYATVVQYFAAKLKLDSKIDILHECELLKEDVKRLKIDQDDFDRRINNIISDHEKELQAEFDLKLKLQTELTDSYSLHKDELERLENAHKNELFTLQEKHVTVERALQEKVQTLESELESRNSELTDLKKEHDQLSHRYDKLEESLTKDKDARVKFAQEKIGQLQKDVDSLNAVLELRLEKLHALERDSLTLQETQKELAISKELNKTLKQQIESASAALDRKREQIEHLTIEIEDLKQKFSEEHKERRRMTMKTEELKYALNESCAGEANQSLDSSLLDHEVLMLEISDIEQIQKDLIDSRHVGLSIIDENKERVIVICLTTEKSIYVIRPEMAEQIEFLKSQLNSEDMTFYTFDGFWDADVLQKSLNIQLTSQIDLVGLDIQLSLIQHTHRGPSSNQQYTIDYIIDKIKPEMLSYQQLLSKWLKANLNPRCTQEEVDAMKHIPLNSMAINAIRRRAGLVRTLGLKMIEEFYSIRDQASQDIYSLALRANDEARENYDRKGDNSFSELRHTLSRCPSLSQD